MKDNVFENDSAKVWVSGNIMFCLFKVQEVDLDLAKDCVRLRLEAASGMSFPTLIDLSAVKSVTKEARDYFGSTEGSKNILASGLVINSTVGKFISNFFLQINKPKIPVRVFTDVSEAQKWLKQFEQVQV